MEEHTAAGAFLYDAAVLLGFALAFVLIFRRLGLGATLGYLVAGAVVGPQVLGLAGRAESMMGIAELGIVLLLFIVGLELNPARLWRMRHVIFGFGLAQVVACGLALFATILALTGYPWAAALAIGLPLGLSSTAQVLPMLQSAGRLRTPFGERAFGILLFQDLSIIPLITIVAALGNKSGADEGLPGWQLALLTLAVIVGLVAAGRFLIRPLFRLIGGLGEREMFVVAGLFTVAISALVMQSLGLSTALGAFIAGVMLSDTPYRHELEADIEPFRSILLGMFFLSVGMMLDLSAIAREPLFVVGMAVALISLKTAIITGLGLAARMGWRSALALGLLLSQGGEFGFVLFAQARGAGIIDAETASLFGAIVTLSMATTPFLMMATKRFRSGAPKTDDASREGPGDLHASALVVGYGRFGQTVAQMLMAGGISVTLIDHDVDRIDMSGSFGFKVYFGDGTRLDLLRQAGGADAQLIMFCIDKDQIEPEFLEGVAEAFPAALIYVRGFDRRSVMRLGRGPQEFVMREVYESAIRMAQMGLDRLGLSEQQRERAEDTFRKLDAERMREQIDTGDIRAAHERMVRRPQEAAEEG